VQLPPSLKFDYDRAEYFYQLLQNEYKAYEFVMEVRHDTWLQDDSLNLMAKYNIGLVISQSDGVFPYSEMVTAKNIYIRFHGPKELYASGYSDDALRHYADKCKAWAFEGHVIWAFFNNDIHGFAFKDAQRLQQLIAI
jgi:uncharacterized protein YecE (DUF72 family)